MTPRISKTPSVEGNQLDTYVKGGFLSIPNLIGSAINNFINSLISLLPFGVGNGLGGLADSINVVHTAAQDAADQVVIIEQQIGQKLSYFDVRSNVPLWQSIHPIGFQSICRSDLKMQNALRTGSTNGDGSHSHSIGTRDPEGAVVINVPTGAAIRCEGDLEIGLVLFYAKGAPGTVFKVRLYTMTPQGAITPITPLSPDFGGQLLNAAHSEFQWVLDTKILVAAGDIVVCVAHASAAIFLAGVDIFDPLPYPGFYPSKIGVALPAGSPGSSYTTAQVSYQGFAPFFSIEPDLGQSVQLRQFAENFNAGLDKSKYNISTSVASQPVVDTGQLTWSSSSDGRSILTYYSPLSRDEIDGNFHVGLVPSAGNAGAISRVLVRARGDATRGFSIGFSQTQYRFEYATAVDTYALVGTYGAVPQQNDYVQFFIAGEHYKVYVNGALAFEGDVSVTNVPLGQGNRYVSLSVRRAAGGFGANNSSPNLNDVFVQDTPIEEA